MTTWPEWDENALRARNLRGLIHFSRNELNQASDEFRTAFAIAPRFLPPIVNLGLVWRKANHHADAEAVFTRALTLDGGNLDARRERAEARFSLRDFQGAIEDYTELTRLAPNDPVAYFNLGFTLAQVARNYSNPSTWVKESERVCQIFQIGYERAAQAKMPLTELKAIENQFRPQETCGSLGNSD